MEKDQIIVRVISVSATRVLEDTALFMSDLRCYWLELQDNIDVMGDTVGVGVCADQRLEWAGLGPGILFLVIGDATETSTVECIVCFVLLEGFPWAQHYP